MLLQFLLFSCITISVYGAGEIAFLHSPSSIELIGQQSLPLSHLSDVFAAGLGFTVQEASDWRGLKVSDPFNFADAVVVVSVPGLSSFDVAQGHKFPLETDIALGDVWSSLETKVAERFPFSEKESAYYLSLDEGRVAAELNFGPLTFEPTHLSVLKNLNPDISHDREFIEQIALLNDIAKKVEEDGLVDNDIDEVPNLYWIVVPGLHPLVDRYGLKSKQVFEAKQQLQASLQRLNEAFEKVFENKVSIAAVASDAPHTRRFRRSVEESDSDEERLNLAPVYSPDFPVMFNIFLWFGIAYTFTLLAVTLGIADMDPGRDSIIYRMTSNRMKKDN